MTLYADKEYANGFPDHIKTHEDKVAYASAASKSTGIPLDPSKYHKNKGLRTLAKFMLNNICEFNLASKTFKQNVFYFLQGVSLERKMITAKGRSYPLLNWSSFAKILRTMWFCQLTPLGKALTDSWWSTRSPMSLLTTRHPSPL